ncbi:acetate--CoA ligase family protein [Pseudomonas chlororaphis]|uniref:acetate--CoA ligase family protein n=1 Tax=Pseudomonas chlororaphis TaxID=587753 RepID=UPI001B3147F8|nr:acetate--CoA ligase family protein [Pseudomonas chlororaphis]MBP5059609.1 acetate--CoA ligase family protein [Pseudomonas chlororaphis]MBP5142242.1 acetate--CoA ligase family protein [Pseudomonas chlororaphis]QTT98332.1 acetate--CoA ligase family protein [Pseudomonas chlororaphis]
MANNNKIGSTALSLFAPSSVAIIGASDDPNKVGGRPIHYMRKFGYAGRILPINPKRETVQGLCCYADLAALDVIPQAAIIAVSGLAAVEAIKACAKLGVATVVVMASGFAETGDSGRQLQNELVEFARLHGMRLIGPNAQGFANFANGAVLNFSTMFMEVPPADGPIAIVSQSGAASVIPYAMLREQGYGVRYLVATGNDADLGVSELTRLLMDDPHIRLILVYVETVSNPMLLAEAAQIARQNGTHIVLLKGGVSNKGAAAAASHTGAMVGQDGALDAFLEKHGIWRAHDIHELVNAAPLYLSGFAPGAGRTVVMSHSGAVGVLCADAAERVGLPLTELALPTTERLKGLIPDFASAANPLDLTAALLGNGAMFPAVLKTLGDDPQADMFLIGIPVAGPGYDVPGLAQTTARFMQQTGKPVVMTAPQADVRAHFQQAGVPSFRNESDAVAALRQYARHCQWQGFPLPAPSAAPPSTHVGLLDEAVSLQLLADAGVPVVEHLVCHDPESAARIAATFGGRVVIKGCAAQVPHKSEHGLVHLNLADPQAAQEAARLCLGALDKLGVPHGQLIVARSVKGLHEFMLGVVVDPLFGPLVVIGEGGTLVEIRKDTVSLLAPFTQTQALEAISRLRIAPVLKGARGQPALDVDALAQAAVALGNFALQHQANLLSVDVNPVMVLAEGVVAVDAVIEYREAP